MAEEPVDIKKELKGKTAGEYIELVQVKSEDEGEGKAIINTIQPITGRKKTSEEMIEDESGFTPTSVTTFFSPIVEVEEMMRRSNTPGLRSPRLTLNMEGWDNDDWLSLITSCNNPELNVSRCLYCGKWPRNLVAHIRLNHKK